MNTTPWCCGPHRNLLVDFSMHGPEKDFLFPPELFVPGAETTCPQISEGEELATSAPRMDGCLPHAL